MSLLITIDCAADTELAGELVNYLKNNGIDSTQEDSLVLVERAEVENILKMFLKETGRLKYSILQSDLTTFVVAKVVPIEEFGLLKCNICGYVVSSEEELTAHQRAHGIQLL